MGVGEKKEFLIFYASWLKCKTWASVHDNSYDCFEESQMTVFLKPVH